MRRVYLDYASLTPIDPIVSAEMRKFYAPSYANPSSLYTEGVAAKSALIRSRKIVADFLTAHPDEIVFTSGGTESNSLALDGTGRAARHALGASGITSPHLIVSAIEHSSILETAALLEKYGFEVTRLAVDAQGLISLDELKKSIKPNTFLISIMTVNNEIGTIQPIRDIAKIVRRAREQVTKSRYPLFHTDAAQAALYQDLNVEKLGVDLLTIDGTKTYGPRGIGALFVRRGTPLNPIIVGGGQEAGLRSGTENIPAIAGLAKSLELARKYRWRELKRIFALRVAFEKALKAMRADCEIIGGNIALARPHSSANEHSRSIGSIFSPHILNVSIPGIDNEFFVLQLDAKGIAVSTKSSCLRDEDDSYVLKAIGAQSRTSVRVSFGRFTKTSDIKQALAIFKKILIPKSTARRHKR